MKSSSSTESLSFGDALRSVKNQQERKERKKKAKKKKKTLSAILLGDKRSARKTADCLYNIIQLLYLFYQITSLSIICS